MIFNHVGGPAGSQARKSPVGGHVHLGAGRVSQFIAGSPLPSKPSYGLLFADIEDVHIRAVVIRCIAHLANAGEFADDQRYVGGNG